MTALATAPATPTAAAPASRARRMRWWLILVGAVVVAIGLAVITRGEQEYADPLDPRNPDPEGAQALARVLEDEGVDVTIARSMAELEAADIGGATTVVVTGTDALSPDQTDHLRTETRRAFVVLVDPPIFVADEWGDQGIDYAPDVDDVPAACDFGGLSEDLEITVEQSTAYRGPGCFRVDEGVLLTSAGDTAFFGAGEALTNDQIDRGDNAAVLLRLLGQDEQLVWYVPSLEDAAAGDSVSLGALLPRWLRPGLVLGTVAVLALMLWRGRRLGPLSVEPLPVSVLAVETARSRGRMYRKAGDRAHAARGLRAAARRRIGESLALGRAPTDQLVIDSVAAHLDRDATAIAPLLASGGPVPTDDAALIRLAADLDQLTHDVTKQS